MEAQGKGKRLVKYVEDYVVFDLETTGTNIISDGIIEISAVKVRKRSITDTFSTLVNPGRSIPYYATEVNGITDEMVADAPDIREALEDFLKFIGEDVLVGHNIQSFDLKFIYREAMGLFGMEIINDYIDTLYMSRSCLPQLKHHKLVDLADYFQISREGAHRALNDCMMNQKCFEALAEIQKNIKIQICPKCSGELKRRNGKFGEFLGCSNFPECRYTSPLK
ncbi:MAG: DNA polymerase III subunit epsilon [Lachnospiraceae bacterium]|nr:DNA polymerase III subunit epsilon [Lachnospiraceae bacterium]